MKQGRIVQEGTLEQLRSLIPAQELVFIQTDEEEKAILQAQKIGLKHRFYQKELAFLMPEILDLQVIIKYFDNITLG